MCRSVRHTPAPPIFTMTSRGPAIFGSGTSSTTGVVWNLWSRTAFMSRNLPIVVRVTEAEHPGADARVGLDAGPGHPGAPQVQRHRLGGDPLSAHRVDEQRRGVCRWQAELCAALAQPVQLARRRNVA